MYRWLHTLFTKISNLTNARCSKMENNPADEYFQSYEDLDIHQLMLKDAPRNQAYRKAIFDNKDDIAGKTVLDVGAGTGILSIYCAQAGAKKVYAVEASNMYKVAEEIVKENKFENVIHVMHGKVEEIRLPEKVDVIVSEWMGFYLFHECMLDSVLIARDKFLKSDGLIFPESATLFVAPCSVPSMYEDWNNVDGVSMDSFSAKLRANASQKPITATVKSEDLLSDGDVVAWLNLTDATLEDLNAFEVKHVSVASKVGKYQGICLWFTCMFPSRFTEPAVLSTAPDEAPTHWKQTTIVLPQETDVEVGSPIGFELMLRKTDQRRYNIEVTMLDPGEMLHPVYCTCHMTKCILSRAVLQQYEANAM